MREFTGLLAWCRAPEFSQPRNGGSKFKLGRYVVMPVLVGGAEECLVGEYTCKGANRDVYLCTLRRRRELGQFVVKVGTTLLSHNASLSEVTLCRRGFTDGIAV